MLTRRYGPGKQLIDTLGTTGRAPSLEVMRVRRMAAGMPE
jgi:hypothetical protein